ncbi:MAG: sigma-70 family RNA polymerase sigma factor [Fimbriimonadaceae bacterium]|nr:sigma-70 family RNA polymerase sigma factor [Fimbriimonadaceae bacterium]
MSDHQQADVTMLLRQANAGDAAAAEALAPLVLGELHAIAERALRRERSGHTLQPTLLADEAFMKLVGPVDVSWQDRSHFYGIAANAIRRLLVDHARAKSREKRGGGVARIPIDQAEAEKADPSTSEIDLLMLDDALAKLAELDPRQARIVEFKYFAGLTSQQIAHVLGVSVRTVDGDWSMARAWLRTQLLPDE